MAILFDSHYAISVLDQFRTTFIDTTPVGNTNALPTLCLVAASEL